MKTIGVLGGLGPQATMDFEARVHRASQKVIPPFTNSGYPPMVVYYYRAAPMLLDDKHAPIVPLVPDPRLFETAAKLRGLADFFVIPSNTPHVFRDELEKAAGCPLLSIIETTIAEVERRGLKRVGLVGFGDPRVYTEPMKAKGIATETLMSKEELDLRAQIDGAILALMEGRVKPEAQALIRKAIEVVGGRGTEAVVLACSELPLLLGSEADESPRLINPTQLLAEAAVRRAIEEG